jgi:DNA-binding ferritin-like protein
MSKSFKKYNKSRNTRKNITRPVKKQIGNKKRPVAGHIVHVFLELLNMIKLYHWKTRSYSQHKATDELYSRLNENIDKFVEVLLGKDQSRIHDMEKRMVLINIDNVNDVKGRVLEYRAFLTDMKIYFDEKKDSDLFSIRDDILADVNQFLYLLSFDKP